MENKTIIFENEMFGNVRGVIKEGKPYFVGKDIAEVLGYSNASKAVIDHCKGGVKEMIAHSQNGKMVKTQTTLIPEGDLFRLIIKSKLPKAQEFESWVMDKVLPSMREYGYYLVQEQEKQRWFATRKETKEVRKQETDMIKTLVEYAREQGSEHPEKYYISYTNLANKTLGIKANERDKLNQSDLLKLKSFETLITIKIEQGIKEGLHYKEIYKKVKNFMEMI